MKYADLRDFVAQLEQQGELKRIDVPVSPYLEMTEIGDRVRLYQGVTLGALSLPRNAVDSLRTEKPTNEAY